MSYSEEVEATEAKMNGAKVDRAPTNQVATNLAVPDALASETRCGSASFRFRLSLQAENLLNVVLAVHPVKFSPLLTGERTEHRVIH